MTILSPISDAAWQEAEEMREEWSSLTFEQRVRAAAFYQAYHDIDAYSIRNTVLRQEALSVQSAAILECFWRRFHEAEAAQAATRNAQTTQSSSTLEKKKPWETFTFWIVVPWSVIFLFFVIACVIAHDPIYGDLTAEEVFVPALFFATVGTPVLWFVASIAWAGGFLSETVVKAGMKATGYDESSSDTKGS